jgi:DNA/RNA-binding domain of Phe-tRNA-synthetase-like protein
MSLKCAIDAQLCSKHPIWLGVIEWEDTRISVEPTTWRSDLDAVSKAVVARFPDRNDLGSDLSLAEGRAAYVRFGLNPKRYPPASEALVRRVVSGKPAPSINTFVDFNNLLSLSTRCPVGSYNRHAINGNVLFRLGRPGESYAAIGNDTFNIENFPTLCDELGPFGGVTRDSIRAMVVPGIPRIVTFVMSFVEPHNSGVADSVIRLVAQAQARGLGQPGPLKWIDRSV